MTITELLNKVKQEKRILVLDLDDWIKGLFVEYLQEYSNTFFYHELLVTATPVIPNAALITGPSDIQKLIQIRYTYDADGHYRTLRKWDSGDVLPQSGHIKYYRRIGATSIELMPFDSNWIDTSVDTVGITYQKRIVSLSDSDQFPVPALESTVLKKVISRVSLYDGDKTTPLREQLASSSERMHYGAIE